MVPNKTIYVSDDDLALYKLAQEIAGGSLSAAITAALRRYVDLARGTQGGYEEITVRVGVGQGRKQRFIGVLLGEWGHSTQSDVEVFRVYRSAKGKSVLHIVRSRSGVNTGPDAERCATGWRSWVSDWSSDQSWDVRPAERSLKVAETLAEFGDLLPPELYAIVAHTADQPVVEDLDI